MRQPPTVPEMPGSQLNFVNFDHTIGRVVIERTAAVTADGLSAATDPGTGITHPKKLATLPFPI